MLTIRLIFTAGRYHATAWGRHVNEGVGEWPPSPYRFLRALYDVWKRKCDDLPESDVRGVLEALASAPPRFTVWPVAAAHTRSYLNANTEDPNKKNLVFDPFLALDPGQACFLTWPEVQLDERFSSVLDRLLTQLNYLGRSESWVEAKRWTAQIEGGIIVDVASSSVVEGETERVACAVSASEYQGSNSWMDALTYSTVNLLRDKDKLSRPPAMRSVPYVLPKRAILTDPPRRFTRAEPATRFVMLGLDSTVLPLVTTTLEVAEQIRTRLMGAHRKRMGGDPARVSELFSGKTADGGKRPDHGHVYILPLGNNDGRIDRVLLHSPLEPFTRGELDAVRGVRELWQSEGRPKVACVVTWQSDQMTLPDFAVTSTVQSATPFVPPRYRHKNDDLLTYLANEVQRECNNHKIEAEPVAVELCEQPSLFEAVEYRRNRKGDPVRPGYFLRITFDRPVRVPFSIGYAAHFGLGLCRPIL